MSGAETWTRGQWDEYRKLIQELAERIQKMGLPRQHPWRGVCRETILNIDLVPLLDRIRSVNNKLNQLVETSAAVAKALLQSRPTSLLEVQQQRIVAEFVAQAPPLDKLALCSTVWNAGLEGLREILEEGRKVFLAQRQCRGKTMEEVWEKDFTALRVPVAVHGKAPDLHKGLVYQIWRSVEAWVNLKEDELLFLEGAEDYDVVSNSSGTLIEYFEQ